MTGDRGGAGILWVRAHWVFAGLAVVSVLVVLGYINLSPRVESDFFFSRDDPQLRASVEIDSTFPSPQQIIMRVQGPNIAAPAYLSTIGILTAELNEVEGLTGVHSVTSEADASGSPMWSRLLLPKDGQATNLILLTDGTDPEVLVPRVEAVVEWLRSAEFDVRMSGVPYVVELIRRSLFRDLVVFSVAAVCVFGIMIAAVYRNWLVVLGTLTACVAACTLTISIAHLLGIAIGLMTANIATIVFVLTLSHMVFITSNWHLSVWRAPAGIDDPVGTAVRLTMWPSFWCMFTTLCGFLSLLIASARPLRELGMAGAVGTVTAAAVAYCVYPAFLRAIPKRRGADQWQASLGRIESRLPVSNPTRWLLAFAVVAVLCGLGVRRLSTDPGLLSYFARGSELRAGLEAIDHDGGSSSLNVVVRDTKGERIDTDGVDSKMSQLQEMLEADSSVGVVLSPVVLLADARRAPLAMLLSRSQLLDLMESPRLNSIALSFVTESRDRGLFFARMRESGRAEAREDAIARVGGYVQQAGLEVVLVGGQYDLQAQLGRLIGDSLRIGMSGLLLLFVAVALVVSRSGRVTVAMVASLAAIPFVILGALGHFGVALDIIASPAANVSLAMGVDSMIHLAVRARREARTESNAWQAWLNAREQLWRPILGAALIICAGFGIFSLSAFPPTQRFGLAVVLGTITAATLALIALPFGAAAVGGRR